MCIIKILLSNIHSDHLTSFALLLGANGGGNGCSSNIDYLVSWISLAFVILAIVLTLIGVTLVEIRMRYKIYKQNQELDRISARLTSPE